MTSEPPRLTRMRFHGPLSDARAKRLVAGLAATGPATVLDLGCGWGELMLDLLDAAPGAKGTGVDLAADDLERGRRNAAERGLGDRAEFVEVSATGYEHEPADVVLCLGSSHALSDATPPEHTAAALAALRKHVAPGGRVLLGESYWERTPTPVELANMWPDASAGELLPLAELATLSVAAGFRVAWLETVTVGEWEEFEAAYLADKELWLADNPGDPKAAEIAAGVERHRRSFLAGYRGVMGQAYLTLVPVA
ncbi:SAM-dependent methyltransferase [Phytomonospora endophytica]|uniref:Cyclopropane fatty-acyl-phospholipid synthase-like methyltransferase n=1 Tax=Phytomonospora endophytica TaxID=714109 RepID=A0A841FIX9_9ACTN|nr:class I SAM-dependent methyltransferase [Phytomonospora endophytica]MBB6033107.1 cyclopropane fatty-acyl-phospholipid synthase-like methyltransferase [Phytomonospora endophytica]GIG65334.1 SAM-dependent methyltransferase [Phytomonospora endophytica]